MTKEDLEEAGIITNRELSDVKLGLLLLKYNQYLLNPKEMIEFKKLEENIKQDLSFVANKDVQKDFLMRALAICSEPIRVSYLENKSDNLEALKSVHQLIVGKQPISSNEKENIRVARFLDEEENLLSGYAQKYKRNKEQLETLFNLIKDKEAFESFCQRYGSMDKESAWKNLEENFESGSKKFLVSQDRYFELFVIHNVKQDARILAFKGTDITTK